jgi:hypothetical protein
MDVKTFARRLRRLSDELIDRGPDVPLTEVSFEAQGDLRVTVPKTPPVTRRGMGFRLRLAAPEPHEASFSNHAHRREYYWLPAADAPAYVQLAWLLAELANGLPELIETGVRPLGLTATDAHADLRVRYPGLGGPVYRLRIGLGGRSTPMEFPAIFIAELFQGGRQERWLDRTEAGEPLVDLRGVL